MSKGIAGCGVVEGRVYKFRYHSKPRIALVLEELDYTTFRAWDFTQEGYRTFKSYDMLNPKDVTEHAARCVIKRTDQISSERMADWDRRDDIGMFETDGTTYAVRF